MSLPPHSDADDETGKLMKDARLCLASADLARAEAHCRAVLARQPNNAVALTLLGVSLRGRDAPGAEAALRRASEIDPRNGDAFFHLGNLYRDMNRSAAAAAAYENALAVVPGHPSILNNLGMVLYSAGEIQKAEAAYRSALDPSPTHRQALANLAHLLCGLQRYAECETMCRRYLEAYPEGEAGVWVNHGICMRDRGDFRAAEAAFLQGLALAPEDSLITANLGSLRLDSNDPAGAEPMLESSLVREPDNLYTLGLLAFCRQALCKWTGLEDLHRRIAAGVAEQIESGEPGSTRPWPTPFTALALPLSAIVQRRVAEHWSTNLAAETPRRAAMPHDSSGANPHLRRGERLRLAYLSADFATHPIAFLLAEVWERHDRQRFETFAYSIGPAEDSTLRTRIENAFDRFRDCRDASSSETAARIRADGIDILIDLNGYTRNARTEILTLRPAPIQIGWLGFLGTSGASFMDYIIADRICASDPAWFSERLILMPDCYCPSDTRREPASHIAGRAASGLPETGFVFCCFNNNYKILPSMFDIWMRLLQRLPHSVLWLSVEGAPAMKRLYAQAEARGIGQQQLIFAPRVPLASHLARLTVADLFLDTLPYNAGTTANDALMMGLPVLTCAGETMAGRVAASQLTAAGLSDLVTADLPSYEELAYELASDGARLSELRNRLKRARTSSPLFDMASFTRALEQKLIEVIRAAPRVQ